MKGWDLTKKIFLLFFFVFMMMGMNMLHVEAEDEIITYPFDQIVIIEAYSFDIEITDAPVSPNFFFGLADAEDIVTVYVGKLRFDNQNNTGLFESLMIVLKDQDDEILASYLNNSFSTDLVTYSRFGFGNWMTIDPEVGVIKDFTGTNQYELTVYYEIINNRYQLQTSAFNYSMIDNSYQFESNLNIIVKAYTEAKSYEKNNSRTLFNPYRF